MNTVLILGAQGNLGCQLQQVFPDHIAWDRNDVDVTDTVTLRQNITALRGKISAIINCVAYNDVDGAESHAEIARILNTDTPRILAELANELGVPLLHYSTGYVFSGNKQSYNEIDVPDPVSVYGRTKADGEQAVVATAQQYYIVRTNLLFGPQGKSEASKKSVVDVMRDVGIMQGKLKGITDEESSFTYTPDLANATKALLEGSFAPGIYHVVNEGTGSWYDIASQIFTTLGKTITIEKVTADAFKRAAQRPRYAVLANTKLPKLRTWQEALKDYLTTD